MSDLRDLFASAGCRNVKTYIQSGNVVFDASRRELPRIVRELRKSLGASTCVFVRTAAELRALIDGNPFAAVHDSGSVKLYVVFLAARPKKRPRLPLICSRESLEAFGLREREVFVVSRPKSNGFFGFPNSFIEKEFGQAATTRNWSTVTRTADLLGR
jgi:uncharacterized protein (DUF1697 family)